MSSRQQLRLRHAPAAFKDIAAAASSQCPRPAAAASEAQRVPYFMRRASGCLFLRIHTRTPQFYLSLFQALFFIMYVVIFYFLGRGCETSRVLLPLSVMNSFGMIIFMLGGIFYRVQLGSLHGCS